MIKSFQYNFQHLDMHPNEIAEILGFHPDKIPDPFPELIEKALKESEELFQITAGYRYFETTYIHANNQQLQIANQTFTPGKMIIDQLRDASSIAIFICTAGNKISGYTEQLAEKGDHLFSYVCDVIGSMVAEKTKEKLIDELKSTISKSGLHVSDPYSPGHCNWDITDQKGLFSLLPLNFCGVRLTESLLMKPVKSVSGIIGIGKTLRSNNNQCNICGDLNCMYGRIKGQKKN